MPGTSDRDDGDVLRSICSSYSSVKTPTPRYGLAGLAAEIFAFLNSDRVSKKRIEFRKRQALFSQGEPGRHVLYIQERSIKVAVASAAGKEAIVTILWPGDFLGESCLAGQQLRIVTATAMTQGSALVIEKDEMRRLLDAEPEFSDRFISYLVTRSLRIGEELINQLFNSGEKRLARALLLLARYGTPNQTLLYPKVSQEVLAEMIGATRAQVNYFMNKFRKLGFIEYDGALLKINNSLLSVVLRE
jgi:CRP-like cAMP-binding protein